MEKETLFELIQNHNKLRSAEEWAIYLKLKDEELESFFSLVYQLQSNYELITTKKGKLQLIEESDLIQGTLSINPKGFGFVDGENESIYIPSDNFNTAMDGDKVLVKPRVFKNQSKEGMIIKVLDRHTNQLVANYERKGKKESLHIDDPRFIYKIKLVDSDTSHCVNGSVLLLDIVKYGSITEVKINHILGHKDDPGMDITQILIQHKINLKFPDAVMEETEQIPMKVSETDIVGRTDYRNEVVVTIDGEDAKDFDDAISIKRIENGYKLDVHIADVSHYIQENSPLDKEARERGTSVYVVDRVVPMLPHTLSNGICSLMEGVNRLTLTCSMEIDHGGSVINYDIHPSVIKSSKRMTYTNVNKVLDGETPKGYEKYVEMIELMDECAQRIRYQRDEKGSINFSSVESKFILNKKREIIDISARVQDDAEMLIEDFMVCANETVAKHMKYLDVPALYRVHSSPTKKRFDNFLMVAKYFNVKIRYEHISPKVLQSILKQFEHHDEYQLMNDMMLRSMAKAHYDHQCLGHFGLALAEYCHFTSPIRRYPDLIVHRMLRRHVFTYHPEQLSQDAHTVEECGLETSRSEQRAVEAERAVESMKKAEFMEKHLGDVFEGVISSVTKFGLFVQLPNTVEGLVHISTLKGYFEFDERRYALVRAGSYKEYRLGQKLKVRVVAASKENQTIDFHIV